jgi:hypothetical protein
MPTDFDSSLMSIFNRLNTLETHTACLNNCYSNLRQYFDYVPTNSEPSSWYPTVKITISGETFHAYESLILWKLSEGEKKFLLLIMPLYFPLE